MLTTQGARSGHRDVAKITKDTLGFLPSFDSDVAVTTTTTVAAVRPQLDDAAIDLALGRNPMSLEQSRLYLSLLDFLCREWDASDPVQLHQGKLLPVVARRQNDAREALREPAPVRHRIPGAGPPLAVVGRRARTAQSLASSHRCSVRSWMR